ncbi:bacterial alpha-L-rhamnosidase domain protein [Aspergillus cavernicola]|uniref:alpha-L-rhamnosidase n=1 Tax=Aspergillus cavernicola TaxID=176166 RepID=A0ABR4HUW5_9EURO
MPTICKVWFEHHKDRTIGIGVGRPRISWRFGGYDTGWVQHCYEIEVTREGGEVETHSKYSDISSLVPWPSSPLASGEKCAIRVRAWNQGSSDRTQWSDTATVEAGLLSHEDWKCSLIEPEDPYVRGPPHRPVVFRGEIALQKVFTSARLYITAHGLYAARINGTLIGDHVLAPGWTSYNHRLVYQTFDVTDVMKVGCNTIDVDVGEGWYCGRIGFLGGRNNIYGQSIGLIAQLIIRNEDGTKICTGTDDSWEWAYGPIIASGLYDGEHYDARQKISSETVWCTSRCLPLTDNLAAPEGPPVRRVMTIPPKQVIKSPSGKTILDFGQNIVGWVQATIHGPAGANIIFQYAEVLEDGECCIRPLRYAKAQDRLTLSSEETLVWEPQFTYHGFRYVQIDGSLGPIQKDDFKGVVIHSDMERLGHFHCSNELLNQLHQNIVWSLRGNFVSIPTDCPQRDERLGWTGDINIFSDTANYLYDTAGMISQWLEDLALEQGEQGTGIVPLVIPNVIEGFEKDAHAIWGDVAIMLPWSLYIAYGDSSILTRQYSSMKAWLASIPRKADNLWNYTSTWKLGDWLDPAAPPEDVGNGRTDPTLVADCFLVHVTSLMAAISTIIGAQEDARQYAKSASELHTVFSKEYITENGRLVADSQTALALAICFSLFQSEDQLKHAARRLSSIVIQSSRFKIATGFAGTPYITHALSDTGNENLAYRMLLHRKRPSWLYPITMGATTMWERWDAILPDGKVNHEGEMTSFNHYALGAVGNWMHRVILGLRPLEPGWRRFKIAPVPGGDLQWAEGSHVTSYGECYVKWAVKPSPSANAYQRFTISVRIPPNTSADVHLPGKKEVEFVQSGTYTWETDFMPDTWPPRAEESRFVHADDEL